MAKLLAAPTKNAVQKELAAQLLNTASTGDPISFDDVDGIPNLPGVLVINRVDGNGTATPANREYIEYSGTSGNTILIQTRNVDGSNAALTHVVGSIVEFIPDVTWADRIYDALATLVDVDDISAINTSIVTTTGTQSLSNKTLTGATLSTVSLINADILNRKTTIYNNGNAGASLAIDLNNGETQKVTLTETLATLSLVNMEAGDYLTLYLEQDATGSRTITLAQSGGSLKYPGGTAPTLTTDANARDVLAIRAYNASVTDVIANSLDLS